MVGGPICWCSTLQSNDALSTTEAEYIVLIEAGKETLWLQGLLDNLSVYQEVLVSSVIA